MAESKLFDANSEAIVLASLLRNPALIHSVNGLRFHMFSTNPHIVLFQEMEELKEKQLPPDPTLVVESLQAKNLIDKAGGKNYIQSLLSKETNDETFKKFVEIVVASYKARSFIGTLSGVKKDSLNITNIDETIYSTRKSLDSLLEMRNSESIVHIGDVAVSTYDEIIARTENPGIRGTTWGIKSLDTATGGKSAGDLWVIGGRPGQGKTALICNSILSDGLAGVPCLVMEREMRTQELMERLISIDTGIPNTNIRLGVLDKRQREQIHDSLAKLKKLPIYIDTNFMATDPLYVEATVNKFHNKHGIQILYIDYIQLMTERDDGQTQAIGRLTRLSKVLANDLSMTVILLSQLNRNVEAREDKRPLLSDLKMSGSLEEDADFAVGLYRDEYYYKETKHKNTMEYIILKHRNGPTGTVSVRFDGPTYGVTEL